MLLDVRQAIDITFAKGLLVERIVKAKVLNTPRLTSSLRINLDTHGRVLGYLISLLRSRDWKVLEMGLCPKCLVTNHLL